MLPQSVVLGIDWRTFLYGKKAGIWGPEQIRIEPLRKLEKGLEVGEPENKRFLTATVVL